MFPKAQKLFYAHRYAILEYFDPIQTKFSGPLEETHEEKHRRIRYHYLPPILIFIIELIFTLYLFFVSSAMDLDRFLENSYVIPHRLLPHIMWTRARITYSLAVTMKFTVFSIYYLVQKPKCNMMLVRDKRTTLVDERYQRQYPSKIAQKFEDVRAQYIKPYYKAQVFINLCVFFYFGHSALSKDSSLVSIILVFFVLPLENFYNFQGGAYFIFYLVLTSKYLFIKQELIYSSLKKGRFSRPMIDFSRFLSELKEFNRFWSSLVSVFLLGNVIYIAYFIHLIFFTDDATLSEKSLFFPVIAVLIVNMYSAIFACAKVQYQNVKILEAFHSSTFAAKLLFRASMKRHFYSANSSVANISFETVNGWNVKYETMVVMAYIISLAFMLVY